MTPAERAFCCRYFSEFFRGRFHDSVGSYWPAVSEALQDKTTPIIVTRNERQVWGKLFGEKGEAIALVESAWTKASDVQHALEGGAAAEDLPEDHLSVLLARLAYEIENKRDTKAFVSEHFGPWLDALSAVVREKTKNHPILTIWAAFDLFVRKERTAAA